MDLAGRLLIFFTWIIFFKSHSDTEAMFATETFLFFTMGFCAYVVNSNYAIYWAEKEFLFAQITYLFVLAKYKIASKK